MNVNIKRLHKEAVIPKYSKEGDAGMDLTAVNRRKDEFGNVHYDTGLAFEIPKGYLGLLFPRSSNAKKKLLLSNSVGVIDSGYRGEVSFKFKKSSLLSTAVYNVGERVGQLIIMPYPQITFKEVMELEDSERGSGSYGSTGK